MFWFTMYKRILKTPQSDLGISAAATLFSGSDARSFCHNKQISPGVSGAAIFMNCIVLELC